jgi:hypothetical protein
MANVLSQDRRQQVVALGRLGWSLRRIEAETRVRRETASGYLRAAGVAVRSAGGSPRVWPPKPATSAGVSTGISSGNSADLNSKPATTGEVSTDSVMTLAMPQPGRAPSASACEPYREVIQEAATRGRNAMAIWQDLVDDHGFKGKYASVRRFMVRLRATAPPEARVVIVTAPGEEAQVDYGEGPMVRDRESGKWPATKCWQPSRPIVISEGRWCSAPTTGGC